jgi:hypothetical protein
VLQVPTPSALPHTWTLKWAYKELGSATQVLTKCAKKIHVRKIVKLYIKAYVFIFYISSFLPKYLCIITYTYEKSPPPLKLS